MLAKCHLNILGLVYILGILLLYSLLIYLFNCKYYISLYKHKIYFDEIFLLNLVCTFYAFRIDSASFVLCYIYIQNTRVCEQIREDTLTTPARGYLSVIVRELSVNVLNVQHISNKLLDNGKLSVNRRNVFSI